MDSSGFSSPRADCFPAGLRVLVVDDDPTWLKILEKMLKKCNYEVTTCNLAREALDLLRERKDGFHIVISDVNMPDMDGFELLEHVGLEMDLPVIMMSVDGETSRVMKGVQHGACDYLLKPIRMKELRNIWQHVVRKRIHEGRDIEGHESLEEIQMMRSGSELLDDGYMFSGDLVSGKKRKDADNKHDDRVCGDPSSVKKARVVWTVDLHQKFVRAVNQIGFEKVGPKKILDLMGVPWLTRENVASHLQKYRLYLSRLQKENELKATFSGKHSDISSKDIVRNVCLQNTVAKNATTMQPSIIANESYAGPKMLIHNDEPKICEGSVKGTLPMSMAENKNAIHGDETDLAKSSNSRISFDHSFGPLDSDVKSESKNKVQYSWSAGVPIPFKQEHKPHFHSEQRFDQLPVPVHHIQVGSLENSLAHNPGTSTEKPNKPTQAGLKPKKITEVESTAGVFSVQSETQLTDYHETDQMPCSIWNTKNHNLIVGTGSALRLWEEGFDFSPQVDLCPPNAFLANMDALGYSNQEVIADIPPHLYDSLKFDSEYSSEYPVIDQGLYIT